MTREARRPGARLDLTLAAAVYALQGVVVSYLVTYNKNYMIAAGVEPGRAAWVETAVLLVLVLKFAIAPLSDVVNLFGLGRRRPFIVVGLAIQSLGLVGVAAIDPGGNLGGYAAMAVLAVVGLAVSDTCCDGLLVDVTPAGERGRVQAIVNASRFVSTMVCTLAFGFWIGRTGLGPGRSGGVLLACAGLGVAPFLIGILTLARGEKDPTAAEGRFDWGALGSLGRRGSLVLLAFGVLYGMIGQGVEFNLAGFYRSLELSPGLAGTIIAVRYAGRAAGALLLPAFRGRIGTRGELFLGIAGLAIGTAGQSSVGWAGSSAVWPIAAWSFAFGVANGWNDVLFCALAMRTAEPRMAASTFSVYMAVSNLAVLGDVLFFEAVVRFDHDYRPAFLLAAAVSLALFALVRPLTRRPATGANVDDLA